MFRLTIFGAAAGLSFLLFSGLARAQCVEDPREVGLDQDNVIRLKSYLCRGGQDQNDPQVTVEFHRLSNAAASILIGGQPPPSALRTAIGAPKLVENATFKAFADLLGEFGETHADSQSLDLTLKTQGSDDSASHFEDTKKKVRTLVGVLEEGTDFPDPEEIQSLQAKRIPPGMHFYYTVSKCLDDFENRPSGDFECHQYDLEDFGMTFWRPMTAADADNFRTNLAAYNRLLDAGRGRKKNGSGIPQTAAAASERYLKLIRRVAGDSWPDDFVILSGILLVNECGDEDADAQPFGLYGWKFDFAQRPVLVDAISITNSSRQAITLQGLFGKEASSSDLRVASAASLPSSSGAISLPAQTISPGQSVLIPLRILFAAPKWNSFSNPSEASEIHARVGANDFGGDVDGFGAPTFKDYAYGPETAVSGLLVDGKRIDLAARADNVVDVTIATGAGSCPYLVSWDGKDREWVEHGKVLHKGQGKRREYSETKTFEGFRARFRLEEREPEIAYIDNAELVAALKNGEMLTLKPGNAKLAARDGDYLELMWGEGVELVFKLPEGIAEDDVAESRLTLTGYYERYSSLMAKKELDSKPRRGAATDFTPALGQMRLCAVQALSRPLPIIFELQARGNP
jgi:hypothetical protein